MVTLETGAGPDCGGLCYGKILAFEIATEHFRIMVPNKNSYV